LPTIIIDWKPEFQFDVSENEVVIFSPSKLTDHLKFIRGRQVKNR